MDQSYLVFVDHEIMPGNTFKLTNNSDGTVTLAESGTVEMEGTPQDAARFNAIRQENIAAKVLQAWNACFDRWRQRASENEETVDCGTLSRAVVGTSVTMTIPAGKLRNHTGYSVETTLTAASSAVTLVVSDKQLNGFKVTPIGTASGTCTASVKIHGGMI